MNQYCPKHHRHYELLGNNHQCQMNCLICCQCLKELDHQHKKDSINHQTITINQFSSTYQHIRNQSLPYIQECYNHLDAYFNQILETIHSQLSQHKMRLQVFIERIMLTSITQQSHLLDILCGLCQGNYDGVRCCDVNDVAKIFFNYQPIKISPGYQLFKDTINHHKQSLQTYLKAIFNSQPYQSLTIKNCQAITEYPTFKQVKQIKQEQSPKKQQVSIQQSPNSRIKTQQSVGKQKKSIRRSVLKEQKQSNINEFRIYIKKPIEFIGSDLIYGKDSHEFIHRMFNKRILAAKILYRASENNFSVFKFHELCDGEPHTLTILHTQFGKIIGGYTPIPWKSTHNTLHSDLRKQSFLFSLTLKQKMILNDVESAVFNSANHGPTFGAGADLAISHNAHHQKTSYAQFPYSYSNPRYQSNNQHSTKLFTGQSTGNHFLIRQWEVWRLILKQE